MADKPSLVSTRYRQSLQKRISSLAAEYARLENQWTAVIGSRPRNPTPEQRRKHTEEVVAVMGSLRKIERRLAYAKRLLARAEGDDYVFHVEKSTA